MKNKINRKKSIKQKSVSLKKINKMNKPSKTDKDQKREDTSHQS